MDDSEPTFSTEPSSSAMRARAFTWVFTRSSQSTAVFADALMVFPLRAMFTSGITRETSPARCPAGWGAAQMSAGIAIRDDNNRASPKAYGDFVFIEDSPGFAACIYRSYSGEHPTCQRLTGSALPTPYMLWCAHAPSATHRQNVTRATAKP